MQTRKKIIKKCFVLMTSMLFLIAGIFSSNLFAAEEPVTKLPKTLSSGGVSDPNLAGNLVQTTLGLLVVLLLIGAAAWAFKRFGNVHVGAQGRMKIIGGISLGTRERAVLLQVGEQQLVVGVSPGRVQTLYVLDTPVPVEEKTTEATSFSTRLQAAILQRKGGVKEGGGE